MARANLMRWTDIDRRLRPETNPQRFACRFLAEGDSWFTLGGEPPWNLLHSIDYPDDNIVVTLAKPGDTLKSMADIANNPALPRALSERFGFRWHAILLSAGGNDLIDYARELLIPAAQRTSVTIRSAADYFSAERVDQVISYIERGYRMIAAMRDHPSSANRATPILTHTYDWATPNDAPAQLLVLRAGPWLAPAFRAAGVPQQDWIAASDYLLGRLRQVLLRLSSGGTDAIANFHVVDTADTLIRAELGVTGESNDWLNEIHPNRAGYDKLARRVSPMLRRLTEV